MKTLQIAMLCHAANLSYCLSLGDTSQVPWDAAPDWQKDSAVKGVEFCLANPDAPASANHDSWMAEKVAAGWVFGEAKDPDATPPTHPCIVPFAELPSSQQFKDVLFKLIVAAAAQVDADDAIIIDAHIGELEAQVATMTKERDEVVVRVEGLEVQNKTLKMTLDALPLDEVTKERDEAVKRAEEAETALKAKPKTVAVKDSAEKLRKFKLLDGYDEDGVAEGLDRNALRAVVQSAETVNIALIDAKGREVPGSKLIVVSGDVWRDHNLGLMLNVPVEITGGAIPYAFAGYALIVEGKHLATTLRMDPINVAPGSKISLTDDIVF